MERHYRFAKQLLMAALAVHLSICHSHGAAAQSQMDSMGVPAGASSFPVEHGIVNLANGELHLEIPVVNYSQRGDSQIPATLVYDSNIWRINELSSGEMWMPNGGSAMGRSGGWYLAYNNNSAAIAVDPFEPQCADYWAVVAEVVPDVRWTDTHGTTHVFPVSYVYNAVGGPAAGCKSADGNTYTPMPSASAYATDGSGYFATISSLWWNEWSFPVPTPTVNVFDKSGAMVASNEYGSGYGVITPIDRNGNYASHPATWTGTCGGLLCIDSFQDTLGRTLVTESYSGNTDYIDVPVIGGGTARYTINFQSVNVQSSFGLRGVSEYGGNIYAISSIVLPDGSSYQFTYNHGSYGELASMTLPHGGDVLFNFATAPGLNTGDISSAAFVAPSRWVQSHTGSDGVTNFAWSELTNSIYSQAGTACGLITSQVTTVSADNTYSFSVCNNNALLQKVVHGAATSSQADAIDLYSYDTTHACPTLGTVKVYPIGCTGFQWMNVTGKTTILPASGTFTDSLTTDIQYGYSNPGTGIPTSVKQWDYYAAAPSSLPDSPPGNPTRETDTTLGYNVNGALFPTAVQHKDATGAVVSSVNYTYDESSYLSASPSSTPNHSNTYVVGNRGNLTTISKCCGWNGTGSVSLTSHVYYDDAGTVTKIADANGNPTSLAYDPTDTFPTAITLPTTGSVSHIVHQTFDPNSGQLTSVTDENSQTTTYNYDEYGRPSTVLYSNGGSPIILQTNTYPSANEMDVSVLQSPGVALSASTTVDGYGRIVQSIQEGVSTETVYDAQGRVYSVSNPHLSTPSSTDGTTYYAHDELGRVSSVTMPNSYATTYTYAGNTVTITDAAGHRRQIASDAFGGTASVLEPNSTGTLTLATTYQYNWQGQLAKVQQKGGSTNSALWRSRTFAYDGAGRLTSQTTPEAGTLTFGYDNNGNLSSSKSQNATNNTTQYYYDQINRLTSMAVGGGPTYTYNYDGQDGSGDPYGKGRMTSASNGSNVQTEWQHDSLGRVVSTAYCLPSDCTFGYKVSSLFDLQGNLTSLTYPDGRQVQWSYNQLNRPVSEKYAQWNSASVNTPYLSNLSYYPAGQLQQAVLGNGVQTGATYDSDANLSSLAYVANGTPIVEKTYSWDKNATNLIGISDIAAGRTESFIYDQLNRLYSMSDSGTTASACTANLPGIPAESQSYSIDPWGNLQASGTYTFSQVIGSNNQISSGQGYVYDSAGNQTQDGLGNRYQYRADGLMSASNSVTYTYDALGQRVRKDGSSSNEYFYLGGQLLAMRNPSTGSWTDRIYGPTGALATVPNSSQTAAPVYRVTDHLGSLNYTLDAAGNIIGVASTLPYGQLAVNTTGDNFLFTDHERDAENGTDATLYRHYASTQGRWLSPDPSNGSYNLADPQSLNRYAYLTNRPMAQVDRLGLDDDDDDWGGDDDDDGGGWWGGWDFSFSFSFDGGTWSWDGGGGPGSTGTTEPGGAPVYAQGWFYAYGTPYGIGDTPYVINDNSPGLDRDGMADFPLAQALFHGGGQPYWGAANKVVTYATVGYAGAVLAAPLAPAAVAAASATATAMSTATTVVTNSAGYAYGYMQGALATGSGVLLGKYISENENYMLDAEEAGLGYFNIGKAGWNIMSRFGNPLVANQGFLDSVLNRGVPIYLGSQPVSDGSFAWELQYLFSQGVSNGELIRHW